MSLSDCDMSLPTEASLSTAAQQLATLSVHKIARRGLVLVLPHMRKMGGVVAKPMNLISHNGPSMEVPPPRHIPYCERGAGVGWGSYRENKDQQQWLTHRLGGNAFAFAVQLDLISSAEKQTAGFL
jgi:hypothetical protein